MTGINAKIKRRINETDTGVGVARIKALQHTNTSMRKKRETWEPRESAALAAPDLTCSL